MRRYIRFFIIGISLALIAIVTSVSGYEFNSQLFPDEFPNYNSTYFCTSTSPRYTKSHIWTDDIIGDEEDIHTESRVSVNGDWIMVHMYEGEAGYDLCDHGNIDYETTSTTTNFLDHHIEMHDNLGGHADFKTYIN